MRNKILTCALLGLGFPLSAMANAPKVVADIAPLHSLVSQVMAGVGEPELIIPAEASPHDYSLRPSQAKALSDAKIVFWMGEELTPWLDKAIANIGTSAQKVGFLDMETTITYAFREGATFEEHAHHEEDEHHTEDEHHDEHKEHHDEHEEHEEHHDEHEAGLFDRFLAFFGHDEHDDHKDHDDHDDHADHDDHKEHDDNKDHDEHAGHDDHDDHEGHDEHDHEGVDPHAWLDPENAKTWVNEIAATLSKADPDNAATYFSNAKTAIAELDKLILETQTSVTNLGELKFIVFHDAYQYFEKRFNIAATGSISLGDAEDPSPARIEEIQNTVKTLGVNCVFSEPQYNSGLVDSVFEGSNVNAIGVMDPLGAAIQTGPQHYAGLIRAMTVSLSECNQ